MKTLLVVAIVADELQERATQIARQYGAQGITFVEGKGIGFPEHHTFFGLLFQGLEKILIFALDEHRARAAEEALNRELTLEQRFKGLVFSLPVEQAMGMDVEKMAAHLDQKERQG